MGGYDMAEFENEFDGAGHDIEIGSDFAAGLVSASCSCGWSVVSGFARPTGEPVARRLVGIKARAHLNEVKD